ncbi:hypothetical protein RclHR1_05660005 [Rhizophagus clarus]|uniref:F-box domain-containing protein n=1 Tax=Rhizophagus clarus TaxID=94130 RepID=A0A2Z6S5H8_9GLOM|nr:hypothetical protein RclHR1_05660005 [Rhizophagus clarus]GES88013.1 hypothetical protein GLOIN_2v1764020 [Rhizophagus clarus]
MSILNRDTLFLIFEEFQEDSKSLLSCLMVNRLWCETTIPTLWKNPWCYNINYSNKNSLYSIITFYLSDDIKKFLIKQKILLPQIPYQTLLFDYLSFCRSIDVEVLNSIISIGTSDLYNKFLLQQEIYSLLMRKCPELKYLNVKSTKHQLFYFPEAKTRLESLCELKCDTSIDSSYFYGLARICQYIQRLIIIKKRIDVNHGVVKLIENQKNLKYFELSDDFEDEEFVEDPYEGILLALENQADVLNHLIFTPQYIEHHEHTIIRDVLIKFHKLKTLIIDDHIPFSEEQLKILVYHELETFSIDFISLNDASIIIENSGGYLKEILLRYYDYEYWYDDIDIDSLNFIRKIYNNCPLLEYLSLIFMPTTTVFIEFEKLLKACHNLKSLLLRASYVDIEEAGETLLKILIRSAPINLREIRFIRGLQFSLDSLEEFFEDWKDRPALSILTSDFKYNEMDYVKLINKYKNNRVIKDFKCDSEENLYY